MGRWPPSTIPTREAAGARARFPPTRTPATALRALATVATTAILAACGSTHSATTVLGARPTASRPTTARPSAPSAPVVAGRLPVGPGSLVAYSVQPQPPPGACHYRWSGPYPLPDPSCTPGAIDPRVTPTDLASTICRTGWTASVRPPEQVTAPEKRASAAAYGYTGSFRTGEYDHLVPLELGGDPDDRANLWVEPNDRPGATTTTNSKDALEDRLHALVCSGRVPLAVAQEAIASNWVDALRRYGP